MTSQNPPKTNGEPSPKSNLNPNENMETIHNLEEDVASLSYLLSTLTAPSSKTNGEKGEDEIAEDLGDLQELLQRLEGAENIASGVEGRVDALLSTLEDLLGTLDNSSLETSTREKEETLLEDKGEEREPRAAAENSENRLQREDSGNTQWPATWYNYS